MNTPIDQAMNQATIFYPVFAMFLLTILALFSMGFARYRAIIKREVSIRFYRTYNEGEQTPRLHLIGRHIQNHFEVPPLFYAGALVAYVTGSVTPVSIFAAWGFVAARYLHSWIHLGRNNVTHRFMAFGLSLMFLFALWVWTGLTLLTR